MIFIITTAGGSYEIEAASADIDDGALVLTDDAGYTSTIYAPGAWTKVERVET